MHKTADGDLARVAVPVVAVVAALGIAAGCGFRVQPSGSGEGGAESSPESPPESPPTSPDSAGDSMTAAAENPAGEPIKMIYEKTPGSFAHLVDAHRDAIVNVRTTRKVKDGPAAIYPGAPRDESLGSGFVVGRAGLVLTDLRVVAQASELRVATIDGESYPAKVVGTDPHLEIALLRAEGLPATQPLLELDGTGDLDVGQWVLALGSPFSGELTANPGVITGVGKRREIANPPQQKYRGYVQTNAAIHAGNSGGPLIDLAGNVVGLSHATSPQASFIGFAVPADEIARVMERLEQGNTVARPWLGIRFQPVDSALAADAGLDAPRGAYVSEVRRGQPAARGGIELGDIILAFDGSAVSAETLPALLYRAGPGKQVELTVWRQGSERSLRITTGRMLQ